MLAPCRVEKWSSILGIELIGLTGYPLVDLKLVCYFVQLEFRDHCRYRGKAVWGRPQQAPRPANT